MNPNLNKLMKNSFLEVKRKWPKNLPNGIIHGDLFIDNIFFKNRKFYGYIDFYFACNDFLMYEIAICINALCFDKKNGKFFFNNKRSLRFATSENIVLTFGTTLYFLSS